MPQLDFSTYAPQLFWLLVSFVTLYLLMARVALPRIATVLEERSGRIARDLDEAQRLQSEADAAAEAHRNALSAAREEGRGLEKEAQDRLAAEADRRRKVLDERLAAKTLEAEQTIAAARTASMANVKAIATEAAAAIVQELAGLRASPGEVERAVDASLAQGS